MRPGEIVAAVERAVREAVRAGQGEVPVRRLDTVVGEVAEALPVPYARLSASLFSHPVGWWGGPESRDRRPGPTPAAGRRAAPPTPPSAASSASTVARSCSWKTRPAWSWSTSMSLTSGSSTSGSGSGSSAGPVLPRVCSNRSCSKLGRLWPAPCPGSQPCSAGPGSKWSHSGRATLRLAAVPSELGVEGARELVVEILERATSLDLEPAGALETLAHELAAGLSCRAAIKINHTLTLEEQRALIADLVATSNPFRCPHGRPIVLRLTQEEMERRLGRR